jgi:hypothetical protein
MYVHWAAGSLYCDARPNRCSRRFLGVAHHRSLQRGLTRRVIRCRPRGRGNGCVPFLCANTGRKNDGSGERYDSNGRADFAFHSCSRLFPIPRFPRALQPSIDSRLSLAGMRAYLYPNGMRQAIAGCCDLNYRSVTDVSSHPTVEESNPHGSKKSRTAAPEWPT